MKRIWIIILALAVVGAAVWYFFLRSSDASAQKYQTAKVTRGDLQATVTSTGTIAAVGTVQVGTQVSGAVEDVFVDFNDRVHRGQLLARLDTRVLDAAVADASANLDRVRAQYSAALDQYNRNKTLFDKKFISALEFNQYESTLASSKASVASARIALDRARTNLGYAEIRSPTDGTIIQRAIEPGQTVAASFSTPTLFTIAKDLSQMQIEASVDEGDIGQIKDGQSTTFTVQSYPDKVFKGHVRQIRLQSQTVQNVVNYTVVIDAPNEEGVLLPGMTATVNFEVNHVANVLIVPNAALRFQPSAEVLEALRKNMPTDSTARRATPAANRTSDSTARRQGASTGGADSASGRKAARSRVWTLDSTGNLRMVNVRIGLSDGQQTEVKGPNVHEGMIVVTGAAKAQTKTTTGTGLPFGSPTARPGGGGGGRGGF